MSKLSRRQLARYAAEQLVAGAPAKKVTRQLAAVLITSQRTGEAELLAADIAWELENRGYFANAQVITARPLAANLRQRLANQIKQAVKVNDVKLSEQVDPSVLGGLRVETARHSWDETVMRRLNELKGAV